MSDFFGEEDISREAREIVGRGVFEGPIGWNGYVNVFISEQGALERAIKMLSDTKGGIDKAIKGAMSSATSYLRSNSIKIARERYAISSKNIRDNENASISYRYNQGIQAIIDFSGYRIPLYRFDGAAPAQPTKDTSRLVNVAIHGKWRKTHPSIAARGHVLKSTSPYTFQNAFVARMPSTGHVGIFERTGGMTPKTENEEIEELFGPSVPEMIGNEQVKEKLAQSAVKKFEERLDHEVLRILNGWGM